MKMKLFEDFRIKFEYADRSRNPEFELLNTLLETRPELMKTVETDVRKGNRVLMVVGTCPARTL
jgi:hypothetical protein